MKNFLRPTLTLVLVLLFSVTVFGQKNNIKISEIPSDVIEVLTQYMEILSKCSTVEEAGDSLFNAGIIGGSLLNSSGTGPSDDILMFSLKKDFNDVKFYKIPPEVTGVTYSKESYDGYQNTLIEGDRYKIWVAKKKGVKGLPAPIPIIKPKEGKPKVVSVIGSL